jgi:hypothetical protein
LTLAISVTADLDTLLIALFVELTDRIPLLSFTRHGPGKPPEVTDAELVCPAVAQVLLRLTTGGPGCAPLQAGGPPVPRLLGQSEYNNRVKAAASR